jgi:AraC-like DNA-binding protein
MDTVLDTAHELSTEGFEAYRQTVSQTFVPLAPERTGPLDGFHCRLQSNNLGLVQITSVDATPHMVVRSAAAARHSDQDFFKVGLQMSGRAVLRQDGREAALHPGDFAIYDTTRPYRLEFLDDYRVLVVMFPRKLLRLRPDAVSEITARTMSGRTGTGALLSPLLAGLEQELNTGDVANTYLSDAVLDLVAACFAPTSSQGVPLSRRSTLLASVKSYIEGNLSDPGLDAALIAKAHHISTSYLQKLFADEPWSVAGHIRALRLDRCRRDLEDPLHALKPAAAIATRWGILDASHFSRLFKNAYGMTPGEYRSLTRT